MDVLPKAKEEEETTTEPNPCPRKLPPTHTTGHLCDTADIYVTEASSRASKPHHFVVRGVTLLAAMAMCSFCLLQFGLASLFTNPRGSLVANSQFLDTYNESRLGTAVENPYKLSPLDGIAAKAGTKDSEGSLEQSHQAHDSKFPDRREGSTGDLAESTINGGNNSIIGAKLSPLQQENVTAFLDRHFSLNSSGLRGQCGQWVDSYKKIHSRIRGGNSSPKYITFAPEVRSGLGDRLLGLVSTFLMALVTERALIVNDSLLEAAFLPGEVDWRPTSDVRMRVTTWNKTGVQPGAVLFLNLKNKFEFDGPGTSRRRGSWVRFPVNLVGFVQGLEQAENLVVQANGGVLTTIFSRGNSKTLRALRAMGLKLRNAYSCILRFLLQPRSEVGALMQSTFQTMHPRGVPNHNICVHMRLPDKDTWDSRGQPMQRRNVRGWILRAHRKLLECAALITRSRKLSNSTKWLYLSESKALRQLAMDTYPNNVITTRTAPMHPGIVRLESSEQEAAMLSATADWLLFSTCRFYVIVDSGYSKTSAAYSTSAEGIFLFKRPRSWNSLGECRPWRPDNFTALGRRWSGL